MMPPKSKTIVCNEHASNISSKLQTFYQDQLFFDISLITMTDNFKVHAHRNVLSACSDYFLAMFCSTLKEAKSDVLELEIDGATLKLVIDFMYTGTIELCYENVSRILRAADVLKMGTLKVACSDFIGDCIDITNWLSIASMDKEQQCIEFDKKVFDFASHNFEELHKTEGFLQLTLEQFSDLISSDDLCVESEETVFNSLVAWVEHDRVNREECMAKLLQHVRFSFLKPEFIKENRHSVCKTIESVNLICSWLESHLPCTELPVQHANRKKAKEIETETLGFVSGYWNNNFKFQTFDPKSNSWSDEDLPPPLTRRTNYGAAVIGKKLIIAGGRFDETETDIVECLDLKTEEWANLPPMREARYSHAMSEFNGELYVFGGMCGTEKGQSVEKYNFRSREWQKVAPLHSALANGKVAVVGELLYVAGDGSDPIECYNPADDKWTQIALKNEETTLFDIAGVGGYLYTLGGYTIQKCKTVERYNPLTNSWVILNIDVEYMYPCKCISWNNRVIICGQQNNNSVAEYNLATNEKKTLAPITPRHFGTDFSSLFVITKKGNGRQS